MLIIANGRYTGINMQKMQYLVGIDEAGEKAWEAFARPFVRFYEPVK